MSDDTPTYLELKQMQAEAVHVPQRVCAMRLLSIARKLIENWRTRIICSAKPRIGTGSLPILSGVCSSARRGY